MVEKLRKRPEGGESMKTEQLYNIVREFSETVRPITGYGNGFDRNGWRHFLYVLRNVEGFKEWLDETHPEVVKKLS